MAKFKTIQTRFTQGQLSQALKGRVDIDQYYGAAEYMKNVFPIPEGGFTRRYGLKYIDLVPEILTEITVTTPTAPNGGTAGNVVDGDTATVLTTTTPVGTVNPYVVCHLDFGSSQSVGLVYISSIKLSTGTSSEFYLQGSTNNVDWVNLGGAITLTGTAKDESRHVFDSYRYIRLARIGSTDLGAAVVEVGEIASHTSSGDSNTKLIEFEFNTEQTYTFVLSDKNVCIYQNGVHLIDLYTPEYTSARIPTVDYLQSADTLIVFHEDVPTKTIVRGDSNTEWTVNDVEYFGIPTSYFDGSTGVNEQQNIETAGLAAGDLFQLSLNGEVTGTISYSATPATTAANIQAALRTLNVTSATGITVTAFFADLHRVVFAGSDGLKPWPLIVSLSDGVSTNRVVAGGEKIWSATRGYPRHGAIYQGRLWVDGGKSKPTIMYGSNIENFFNFNFGRALDDEAIGPLSFEGYNEITNIFAGKELTIFTTGGEYVVQQTLGEPITPTNAQVITKSQVGSESGFKVKELDGGVYYIQRGRRAIRNFLNDNTSNVFSNSITSFIGSDLVVSPVDFTIRETSVDDQYSYLLLPTADGNLTVSTILSAENIAAFTYQVTEGEFLNVANDQGDMYVIVKRNINGTDYKYFEMFDKEHFLDSSVLYTTGLPTDTFTGLDHLNGEVCRSVADYVALSDVTPSSGSVTISTPATEYCEVGLDFNPYVKDLPYENPQVGSTLGRKQRVSRADLRLKDTRHVKINNKDVSIDGEFTGVKTMYGITGWGEAQIEITQDDPLPMTVLSIAKRVTV